MNNKKVFLITSIIVIIVIGCLFALYFLFESMIYNNMNAEFPGDCGHFMVWTASNYNGKDKAKITNLQKYGYISWSKDPERTRIRDEGRLIRKGEEVLNYLELIQFELLDDSYQGTQFLHNFKCLS